MLHDIEWTSRVGALALLLVLGVGCAPIVAPSTPATLSQELTTESLVGCPVMSRDGSELGSVDGVLVTADHGVVEYVVVRVADPYNFGKGSAGAQDRFLLVPWAHVEITGAPSQLVVDLTAAEMAYAPMSYDLPDPAHAGWDDAAAQFWTAQATKPGQ